MNSASACVKLASCCSAETGLITHGAGVNGPAAAASVSEGSGGLQHRFPPRLLARKYPKKKKGSASQKNSENGPASEASVKEICNVVDIKTNQEPVCVCGLAGCDSGLFPAAPTSQAAIFELGHRGAISFHKVYRFAVQTLTACLCKQATRLMSE